MSKGTKRPHADVMKHAQHIAEALTPFCERIEIAGSLRRGRDMVGDIELVALPKRPLKSQLSIFDPPEIDFNAPTELDSFLNDKISEFRLNGPRLKSFQYAGIQVDLFLPLPDYYGWRLVLSTGSGAFNKWLVTTAAYNGCMPRDMCSKDGYLWRAGVKLQTPEEADAFRELGLPFIPLDMRDDDKWHEFIGARLELSV